LEVTLTVGSPAAGKRFDTGLWHTQEAELFVCADCGTGNVAATSITAQLTPGRY